MNMTTTFSADRVPLAEIARVHRALRGTTRRVEVFVADEPM
jgi:hypothetical protein